MDDALVLCYHAVGGGWPAAVPPARLQVQIELLLRRGLEPATFADAVLAETGAPRFAVTFDDAYVSVLEQGFPILERLGVPATVFAVTTFADRGCPLDWPGLTESGVSVEPSARRSLAWDDLRRLADAGWEVGSHTRTHPRLTALDDEALDRELVESRASCARALDRPCRSIAYPYGAFDERVLRAARAAGYEAGCSLSIHSSGRLAWPRVGIYGVDTLGRFRLKVSPTVLRLRRTIYAVAGRPRRGLSE